MNGNFEANRDRAACVATQCEPPSVKVYLCVTCLHNQPSKAYKTHAA